MVDFERFEGDVFELQAGDDCAGVLTLDFAAAAAEHADEPAYVRAVREQACRLDPELAELGEDPDATANVAVATHQAWSCRHLMPRTRARRSPPAPPSRPVRLWLALMERRRAAWSVRQAELEWERERGDRVRRCGAPLEPRDHDLLTAKTWARSDALETVRVWEGALKRDPDTRRVLVLLGSTGVGKTFASVAWATCARRSAAGIYVRMRDLAAHWTAAFGHPDAAFVEWLNASMLVVDELGWEHTPATIHRGASILHELLEVRARPQFSTILISNRAQLTENGRAGFLEHYAGHRTAAENEPLLDRLRSRAIIVELAGPSMRKGQL